MWTPSYPGNLGQFDQDGLGRGSYDDTAGHGNVSPSWDDHAALVGATQMPYVAKVRDNDLRSGSGNGWDAAHMFNRGDQRLEQIYQR